jgi:hypothetical protein
LAVADDEHGVIGLRLRPQVRQIFIYLNTKIMVINDATRIKTENLRARHYSGDNWAYIKGEFQFVDRIRFESYEIIHLVPFSLPLLAVVYFLMLAWSFFTLEGV